MSPYLLRNTLVAILISAATASSAIAQEIVITAPEERVVGRTNFGADVVEYTTSFVVEARDIDLRKPAGWNAMERRLTSASHTACNVVEQRIPIDLRSDRRECERAAYRGAIEQARRLARTPL